MTRVTDEDLNSLEEVIAGIANYSDPATGLTVVLAVRAELLALRKVADAAVKLEDAMVGIPCECSDKSCELLCKALREAGL